MSTSFHTVELSVAPGNQGAGSSIAKPRYRLHTDGSHSLISCGHAHFTQLASALPSYLVGLPKCFPYPQTPQSAHTLIVYHGITVSQWSRDHSFSQALVREVLAGRKKGLRGQAHNIAIALGIKHGIPTNKPARVKPARPKKAAALGAVA